MKANCRYKCHICKKVGNHHATKCFWISGGRLNKDGKQKPPQVDNSNAVFNTAPHPEDRAYQAVSCEKIIADSGSTAHLVKSRELLSEFLDNTSKIRTANGSVMASPGTGKLGMLKDVKVVPTGLVENLMSVAKLCQDGWTVTFHSDHFDMKHEDGRKVVGEKQDGLYSLPLSALHTNQEVAYLSSVVPTNKTLQWHNRLFHANLGKLQKGLAQGTIPPLHGLTQLDRNYSEMCRDGLFAPCSSCATSCHN